MTAKLKNVDKEHKLVKLTHRDVARYELRIDGQTADMDNNLMFIEKEFAKSNSRVVTIMELSPGIKKVIKSKTNYAGENAIRGRHSMTYMQQQLASLKTAKAA